MPQNQTRTLRVKADLSPDVLAVIKRAAELQGRSVSDFIAAAAQEAAHRLIEEAQLIRLSVHDQGALVTAISNPPAPTAALIRAAEAHRRLMRGSSSSALPSSRSTRARQ